jgi:uncharacterized damage-inducible protein DinB
MRWIGLVLLCCACTTLVSQAQQPPANPVVESARPLHEQVKGYVLRAVDQMPEEHYGFKPTPDVRSFGQLIAHIATTQYLFCSAALGEQNPETRDFEKSHTTKTALAEAIQASFKYCDRAYVMPDAQATKWQAIKGWGERAPLSILILNIGHNNEHYGNIVTYMRLKGLVPPSSQPSK